MISKLPRSVKTKLCVLIISSFIFVSVIFLSLYILRETRNWKTYRNKDFLIQYPSDTKMEKSGTGELLGFKNINIFSNSQISDSNANKNFYRILFSVIKESTSLTAEDLMKTYIQENAKDREDKILTSFSKYSNGKVRGFSFRDPGKYIYDDTFFILEIENNVVYIFEVRGNNQGLSERNLFSANKIISTFIPNKTILPDKKLSELIYFDLPAGWKLTELNKEKSFLIPEGISIKSPDWNENDPHDFMHPKNPGLSLTISRDYGGSIYPIEEEYRRLEEGNTGPESNPDMTALERLTIGGYPALTITYWFETHDHIYQVWQDDNIWTLNFYSYQEEKYANEINKILSSIRFVTEE